MNGPLCICYHGTSRENAEQIRESGFNPRTYFAKSLQDALGFGGPYVFQVVFEKSRVPDDWQWIEMDAISPERITKLVCYEETVLYEDDDLRKQVFESQFS